MQGIGTEVCSLTLMKIHEVLCGTMARKDKPASDSSSSLLSPFSSLLTPSFLPLTHPQCPASAMVPFLLSIWQQPILAQIIPDKYSVTWELTLWPLLDAWSKVDGLGGRGEAIPSWGTIAEILPKALLDPFTASIRTNDKHSYFRIFSLKIEYILSFSP